MKNLKHIFFVELIGTFCLCFSVLIATIRYPDWAAAIIGIFLIALVYAGYRVSGSQYNPLVSFSIKTLSIIQLDELLSVIIAQLLASVLAFGLLSLTKLDISVVVDFQPTIYEIMWTETLGTFILVWVILEVATVSENIRRGVYGIAIGTVVIGISFLLSPIGEATYNPAVLLSTVLVGWVGLADVPIHLIGQIFGAAGATYFFKVTQS